MKTQLSRAFAIGLLAFAGLNVCVSPIRASDQSGDIGEVRVHVSPEEAYIWVDNKAVSHRSSTLKLTPGEHKITVYNYGFKPHTQTVNVVAGERQEIEARLEAAGSPVSGPWGRIQIEGVRGNALVFLNGTTPEFFVGHVDEMNNEIFSTQALIVPVGKQQVHVIANKTEEEIWAGTVEVRENERAIIYTKNPPDKQIVYKSWPEGAKLSNLKRFEAGTASAKVAVAPVKAKLALDQTDIKCNEPVKLSWDSTDAPNTVIKTNDKPIAYSNAGAVETRPHESTKYEFHATGPGGVINSDVTVNVDTKVSAWLTPTQSEMRYVKVGNKVQEQGSTELRWSAQNADSVKIEPIGTVNSQSGSQTIQANPSQSAPGNIDETVNYKLTATNVCGGSDTTTASVHVTGSIEPEQVASAEPAPQLPNSASPLPLLGLLGVACLGGAGVLRRSRR
ncbi:MAG TPA: PEGA domain-containing protein [Candidatus Angelobacter sp.]|nr:PEGA domain-containing protein [Candidatus Angelobacter sp.]